MEPERGEVPTGARHGTVRIQFALAFAFMYDDGIKYHVRLEPAGSMHYQLTYLLYLSSMYKWWLARECARSLSVGRSVGRAAVVAMAKRAMYSIV